MRKNYIIFFLFSLFLLLSNIIYSAKINIGDKAPYFSVLSGDDKLMSSDIATSQILMIFYETREVVNINRELKNELNKFYFSQPPQIKKQINRLAIIKIPKYTIRSLWAKKLVENSEKENIIIYGDWDNKMFKDYDMVDHESNFLIIDKKNVVRYIYSGKFDENKFGEIKQLLLNILNEK